MLSMGSFLTPFRTILLLTAGLLIVSHFKKNDLEEVPPLLPDLRTAPIQRPTTRNPFTFTYRGTDYLVEPVAEYELYGLIVSHNDINSFIDIYHTEDSVDIKDICVIWGINARSRDYKNIKFWSEPWTCWARWGPEGPGAFDIQQLSNNHLLSDRLAVRKRIRDMTIGDQIYIKGLLVNYQEKAGGFVRRTSVTRTDDGNGACEVLFAEEARILKKGPQFWQKANRTAKSLLIMLLIGGVLAFLHSAYKPYRK